MIRIAILASTATLRIGLRSILTGSAFHTDSKDDFEVVFDSGSLVEFLQLNPQADVLLLDGELIDPALLTAVASSQEGHLGILVLSSDRSPVQVLSRLPLRGWGLLTLDASAEELQAAVRSVAEGLLVGSPGLLTPLYSTNISSFLTEEDQPLDLLTGRELQILQLLALGLANKQIAKQLAISEHTVKFHISSVYTKLGVASRTEAVRSGLQRGLITL